MVTGYLKCMFLNVIASYIQALTNQLLVNLHSHAPVLQYFLLTYFNIKIFNIILLGSQFHPNVFKKGPEGGVLEVFNFKGGGWVWLRK